MNNCQKTDVHNKYDINENINYAELTTMRKDLLYSKSFRIVCYHNKSKLILLYISFYTQLYTQLVTLFLSQTTTSFDEFNWSRRIMSVKKYVEQQRWWVMSSSAENELCWVMTMKTFSNIVFRRFECITNLEICRITDVKTCVITASNNVNNNSKIENDEITYKFCFKSSYFISNIENKNVVETNFH